MAKILLVEDDNNLREIYEARLQAEGYDIVSAQDGEDALVKAKQEKPDLVISDVMMPRISGFEMLDILRNTEGLKDAKVIMLTALGQAEDKTRADALGADRYLVKSQVTLEDIVHAADELLNGGQAPADSTTTAAAPSTPSPTTVTEPAPGSRSTHHRPHTRTGTPKPSSGCTACCTDTTSCNSNYSSCRSASRTSNGRRYCSYRSSGTRYRTVNSYRYGSTVQPCSPGVFG